MFPYTYKSAEFLSKLSAEKIYMSLKFELRQEIFQINFPCWYFRVLFHLNLSYPF